MYESIEKLSENLEKLSNNIIANGNDLKEAFLGLSKYLMNK